MKLRAPDQQAEEDDVNKLKDYTVGKIRQLRHVFAGPMATTDFVELRDAVCSRLTLFNARRGGESSRLTCQHIANIAENAWVDKTRSKICLTKLRRGFLRRWTSPHWKRQSFSVHINTK